MKARSPLNSSSSEYDLVIADRDGSNARVLFPYWAKKAYAPTMIAAISRGARDGRTLLIAVVYQVIYIIDAGTGRAIRATLVGSATLPRWRW
ncbi:MAG: hypothetical protein U0528_09050 [Anaerolineae bacterium]